MGILMTTLIAAAVGGAAGYFVASLRRDKSEPRDARPASLIDTASPSDAASNVISKCEDNWDNFKSNCSGFAEAVAGDLQITLTGQADDIVDQINGAGWTVLKATSGKSPAVMAKEQADAGKFVLAAMKGQDHNPSRKNGHVAIVVSGELDSSGRYPHAYWGALGGVGRKNATINYSWNAADRDRVTYSYTDIP